MSEEKGQNQSTKKEGGSGKLLIIIGVIIIVFLLAIIVILLLRKTPEQSDSGRDTNNREVVNSSRMILDEGSAQSVIDEMRNEVEEGMFACSMSTNWTFADGNTESQDAYVANSTSNTHPFYFDVMLDGSDEIIYSSPVIPVGSSLTNFKLDKPLSAGTYEAVCMYYLLKDEESQEVTSSAGFIVTINVTN